MCAYAYCFISFFFFCLICRFSQHSSNDLIKEEDNCLKQDEIDHSKNIETEVGDLSESVTKEKVSSVLSENPESDEVGMDAPDVCGEQKSYDNAGSQMVCYGIKKYSCEQFRFLFPYKLRSCAWGSSWMDNRFSKFELGI